MNGFGFQNPFFPAAQYGQNYMPIGQQTPGVMAQQMQVVRVNGENGARAFQMGPNSSALLLDESGTIVWLATSDGAGYRTVSAYDIAPHQTTPAPDFGSLEARIARLESVVNATANSATTGGGQSTGGEPVAA